MAKKRTTLVKDFREIMGRGDFEELKAVFDKCDINAIDGKYGPNAFGFKPLSREFAFWLKEQGCDINLKDYYGSSPIFSQVSRYQGNLPLMIELGADVTATDRNGYTLFHRVAGHGTVEDVKLLLEKRLNINAKQKSSVIYKEMYLPIEVAFNGNRRSSELLDMVKILIENGAKITDRVKKSLTELGTRFEFCRSSYNKDFIIEDSHALIELYKLIGVTPVAGIDKHDGVSPIIINEDTIPKQYEKMWEYLVPSSGVSQTGQGEAIRIAGKVAREIMDNGGMNWDSDYKKMLDIFPQYFELGNRLPDEDIADIKRIVKVIYNGKGDSEPETLMNYAVKWIMINQTVIPVIPPTYKYR